MSLTLESTGKARGMMICPASSATADYAETSGGRLVIISRRSPVTVPATNETKEPGGAGWWMA